MAVAEGGCTLGSATSPEHDIAHNDESSSPESATVETPEPICPPNSWVNVPHPTQCNAYYMCVGGIPMLRECTTGTAFSSSSLVRR